MTPIPVAVLNSVFVVAFIHFVSVYWNSRLNPRSSFDSSNILFKSQFKLICFRSCKAGSCSTNKFLPGWNVLRPRLKFWAGEMSFLGLKFGTLVWNAHSRFFREKSGLFSQIRLAHLRIVAIENLIRSFVHTYVEQDLKRQWTRFVLIRFSIF
jgi:hypothetical protein